MRRAEIVYLALVLTLGGIFGGRVVSDALRAVSGGGGPAAAGTGVAGEPRDVDQDKLGAALRRGDLSDREALYSKSVSDGGARSRLGAKAGGAGGSGVVALRRELQVMGTEGTLTAVVAERRRGTAGDALAAAEAALRRIDALMSTYQETSEIARFNAAGAGEMALSPDTLRVLAASRQAFERSQGAFDVTCGPLLERWKRAAAENRRPSAEELKEARERSRWDRIRLTLAGVAKDAPGVAVDLGGIAKGYGIDHAVEELRLADCAGGLVELGGDLRCFGRSPEPGGWRVAITNPYAPERRCAELLIAAGAVCTSGHYTRFAEIDGQRYSHIVDPRTGWPAEGTDSVTVVAPLATDADAWATALAVLGPAGVELLAAQPGVEALVISGGRGAPTTRMTRGFVSLLTRGPEF